MGQSCPCNSTICIKLHQWQNLKSNNALVDNILESCVFHSTQSHVWPLDEPTKSPPVEGFITNLSHKNAETVKQQRRIRQQLRYQRSNPQPWMPTIPPPSSISSTMTSESSYALISSLPSETLHFSSSSIPLVLMMLPQLVPSHLHCMTSFHSMTNYQW